MRQREHTHMPVRSGALTLLITVVAVCLAVLAVLAFSTARADRALAQRALDRFALDAACENEAWRWLAEADEALATDTELPGQVDMSTPGFVQTVIEGEESRRLTVRLALTDDGWRIDTWKLSQSWQADESLDLWDGSF
mgnify:FL=1